MIDDFTGSSVMKNEQFMTARKAPKDLRRASALLLAPAGIHYFWMNGNGVMRETNVLKRIYRFNFASRFFEGNPRREKIRTILNNSASK